MRTLPLVLSFQPARAAARGTDWQHGAPEAPSRSHARGHVPKRSSYGIAGPGAPPGSQSPAVVLSSAGERRETEDLHFKELFSCKCCCTVLLPLRCIFQQNELSRHQSVKPQESKSLTDTRQKEQDHPLCFWVGWKEGLPKFPLTSSLAQPFLACQAATCTQDRCWSCLPGAHGCAFASLLLKHVWGL